MQMCSNGHDEIVYEENLRICPLCDELKTNIPLSNRIDELENEIEVLKDRLREAYSHIGGE